MERPGIHSRTLHFGASASSSHVRASPHQERPPLTIQVYPPASELSNIRSPKSQEPHRQAPPAVVNRSPRLDPPHIVAPPPPPDASASRRLHYDQFVGQDAIAAPKNNTHSTVIDIGRTTATKKSLLFSVKSPEMEILIHKDALAEIGMIINCSPTPIIPIPRIAKIVAESIETRKIYCESLLFLFSEYGSFGISSSAVRRKTTICSE